MSQFRRRILKLYLESIPITRTWDWNAACYYWLARQRWPESYKEFGADRAETAGCGRGYVSIQMWELDCHISYSRHV